MREYPKRIFYERVAREAKLSLVLSHPIEYSELCGKLLRYKSNFLERISDILLLNNIKICAS